MWTSYTFNLYNTLRSYKDQLIKDCFIFSEVIGWEKDQHNSHGNVLGNHLHNRLHEIKLYADEASIFYSRQGKNLQNHKDKLDEVAEALKIAENCTVSYDAAFDSLNECINVLSSEHNELPRRYIFFVLPIINFLKALMNTKKM